MIRLLTVFFLVCLSICSIKSQSKINCSKEEKYTKRVSIQSGKNYAANISGKMCYNYNRNILISVSSIYSVNDNVLTQKKAEGQGHKLYLVNVEHNAVDAYVLNYPDPTQEIKDTLWLMLKAKDDAYWTAKRMELTLKFLYIRKKAGQEQEFVLDFALPDHPKPVEKSKVDSALMDSIHAAAKASSPQVKKKRRVRKPVVKYPKTDEFLDSIRFYFKNMSTLYDEVADHSALGTEDKDQFEQRYHVCV